MVKTTGETAQVHASSAPTRGHNSMAENMAASSFSIHGGVICTSTEQSIMVARSTCENQALRVKDSKTWAESQTTEHVKSTHQKTVDFQAG